MSSNLRPGSALLATARTSRTHRATISTSTANIPHKTLPISAEDIHNVFSFFDPTNKGLINIDDLRQKLSIFYHQLPNKDLQFLLNGREELSEADLMEILHSNTMNNNHNILTTGMYDPIAEAFKVYDPTNTGIIDLDILRNILLRLGFNELTSGDLQTLVDIMDEDQDGKINLEDFRQILNSTKNHNAANNNNNNNIVTLGNTIPNTMNTILGSTTGRHERTKTISER